MNSQTDLAEVSRIVGIGEVQEVRELIGKVIQGRENKHKQSIDTISKLNNRITEISHASEELEKQYSEAECQIDAILPEVNNERYLLNQLTEKVKSLNQDVEEQRKQHKAAIESLLQTKQRKKDYSEAFRLVFGIKGINFESKGEEIEIIIQPDHRSDFTYTILCSKDRAKKGIFLQVVGVDPAFAGFEELERSYTTKTAEFVEVVMKSRQLSFNQPDLPTDF